MITSPAGSLEGAVALVTGAGSGIAEALRQELVEHVRVAVVEPGTARTELVENLGEAGRDAAVRQIGGIEPLRAEDIADAIGCIVTRERRVTVNAMPVRAGDQTW
ncbi:hypothetical protein ACIGDI_42165 [Streptomyces sp. NPDC085900]|uniref:hypothetical protein n=1 Tax=Streptomyces sp. NPDC085900 TaxID=3365737 RepID=UPI0037D290CC